MSDKLTKKQKEEIYKKMSSKNADAKVVAKELGVPLSTIMDAVVDVLSEKESSTKSIPETSVFDGDDMVGDGIKFIKGSGSTHKTRNDIGKSVKWTDVLGIKVSKTAGKPPIVEIGEPDGVSLKVEKIDIDNHPELKQAASDFFDALTDKTTAREEPKHDCKCVKQHNPISIDKLGALAYRLSKLHMSEDMIVKVLNITLGVPEPTIREALV